MAVLDSCVNVLQHQVITLISNSILPDLIAQFTWQIGKEMKLTALLGSSVSNPVQNVQRYISLSDIRHKQPCVIVSA